MMLIIQPLHRIVQPRLRKRLFHLFHLRSRTPLLRLHTVQIQPLRRLSLQPLRIPRTILKYHLLMDLSLLHLHHLFHLRLRLLFIEHSSIINIIRLLESLIDEYRIIFLVVLAGSILLLARSHLAICLELCVEDLTGFLFRTRRMGIADWEASGSAWDTFSAFAGFVFRCFEAD